MLRSSWCSLGLLSQPLPICYDHVFFFTLEFCCDFHLEAEGFPPAKPPSKPTLNCSKQEGGDRCSLTCQSQVRISSGESIEPLLPIMILSLPSNCISIAQVPQRKLFDLQGLMMTEVQVCKELSNHYWRVQHLFEGFLLAMFHQITLIYSLMSWNHRQHLHIAVLAWKLKDQCTRIF